MGTWEDLGGARGMHHGATSPLFFLRFKKKKLKSFTSTVKSPPNSCVVVIE